ncbi:hypothetical protein COI76_14355 [Bacillus cereus]|uniref:acyltransferase n=1 Tax=Bacillus sp. AW TaxID=2293329 RepID=UPI000BF4048B|nr:hypothetical protein COI76_14355 [Bacillus cereus]RFB74449.1 acyltransferase [Bacillus sp. AW]
MGNDLKRYSNFELLKIVSILMVLTLHYFNGEMGGALHHTSKGTSNYYLMYLLESMSIIAVNCFVLVTGYFMVSKTGIKLKKAINLLSITVFYGILFYFVNGMYQSHIGNEWFSLKSFVKAAMPFYGSEWFVSTYVVLFLLAPFINIVLQQLTKSQFKQLLVIMIICFSVLPTLLPLVSYNDNGYGVLSFILIYCIGAYLKLYGSKFDDSWRYVSIYLVASICTFALCLTIGIKTLSLNYNTIFNVAGAVAIFIIFMKIKFHSNIVNYLATFTFAIYIIHTDISINEILFREVLDSDQYWNSPWFIPHFIVSVIALFFGCVAIEAIRRYIMSIISRKIKFERLDKITIGQIDPNDNKMSV